MTRRDGGALERRRGVGRISGDELYIVLGHQTNSALQDSLQPAGLQTGTN